MKDIVYITVQYNNAPDTEIFLESVGRTAGRSNCEVIVVDNSDEFLPAGKRGAPTEFEIRELRPPQNLYYWGGAAFALESSYGASGPWPRWIIVCNNDVEITDQGFLEKLERLDPATHPIVAPAIISHSTGKDQNPMLDVQPGFFKRLKWRVYDTGYAVAKTLLAIHAAGRADRTRPRSAMGVGSEPARPRLIYAPHGACIIFSSAFFEKGGELDTAVPLFAEELTLAAFAEKAGMPIWYWPDIRVSHREHSTTGRKLTKAKYEMERMARRRYYELRG
ncbi:MAG TPA: glycosyltransferase [Gemmatimonadaceae bacterium]|nr:glycosyltransferase [Gemmatimonadaceae bacterium]